MALRASCMSLSGAMTGSPSSIVETCSSLRILPSMARDPLDREDAVDASQAQVLRDARRAANRFTDFFNAKENIRRDCVWWFFDFHCLYRVVNIAKHAVHQCRNQCEIAPPSYCERAGTGTAPTGNGSTLYKVKKYCVSCWQSRMLGARSRNFTRSKGAFYGMKF